MAGGPFVYLAAALWRHPRAAVPQQQQQLAIVLLIVSPLLFSALTRIYAASGGKFEGRARVCVIRTLGDTHGFSSGIVIAAH
ncbi:hypothetical protein BSKO_07973 [Bryopsis sp. KO-2023]|nr:hypothetical protein BSKO_07973 [Bryopsis sp. KO-2023]